MQMTIWSGIDMKGIKHVILACFIATMRQSSINSLMVATLSDSKVAIKGVYTITDFCLIAQYYSYTLKTIGYIYKYL